MLTSRANRVVLDCKSVEAVMQELAVSFYSFKNGQQSANLSRP